MTKDLLEAHIQEMVGYAIKFAYEDYLLPNAVEGGNLADAIPYFAEHPGNLYDTAEIRQAVREIFTKAFTETKAIPYPNKKDAGQIILAGPLGSAARLREAIATGKNGTAELREHYETALKHSIKSDFDLFKAELSQRNIHGYDLSKHSETFSRIRGLCSGMDVTIQRFAPLMGFGAIVDNTLAPVTDRQIADYKKGFPKICAKMHVTVIGLALTPEEAKEQSPTQAEKSVDTAKAFAEHINLAQENASRLILLDNNMYTVYSHNGPDIDEAVAEAVVDIVAVQDWKRSNNVAIGVKGYTPKSLGMGLLPESVVDRITQMREQLVANSLG